MPGRFERLNIRIGRFILPLTPGASANDGGTLKGVVSDKNGPLVGVAVYVKDTNNGVSSDIDGNYLLAGLEEGDVIVFSLLGFDTVEITWTGQALQDVVLDASADFLDEVVVVGYGVQKKVNLTGSVSTVDSDELDMRPVANITQSLQGLVPGLTVNNTNSGRPGAEATLQIRGQGNLSGTSTPYVLVDGVEMDLADVNPNDVESISVLKDASASAIYGARAAYGVILVTTKSGEKGKIRVSYNGKKFSFSCFCLLMGQSYALKHFRNITLSVLTGFMLGSLNKVWPWKETVETFVDSDGVEKPLMEMNVLPNAYISEAVILMIVGFLLIYILEKISMKLSK